MNLKKIIEYKASFILQAITMLISNSGFFIIWYFILKKVGNFGGFGFTDYMILFDSLLLNFSFAHIFFGGYRQISQGIVDGTLDSYLLMPKSLLLKILSSSIPTSIFGDFINALLIPFFVPGFTFWLFIKICYLSFVGSLVFLGVIILMESLSFFIGSSKELARAGFEMILGPSNYPERIYEGTFLKLLFVTIIPVYYTFYLPFNLARSFEWKGFIILHLSAIIFLFIGIFTFYRGLRRYESGNLVNVNG